MKKVIKLLMIFLTLSTSIIFSTNKEPLNSIEHELLQYTTKFNVLRYALRHGETYKYMLPQEFQDSTTLELTIRSIALLQKIKELIPQIESKQRLRIIEKTAEKNANNIICPQKPSSNIIILSPEQLLQELMNQVIST